MSELSLIEQKQLVAEIRSSNPQLKGKSDKEVLNILASNSHNLILTPAQKNSILQITESEGCFDKLIISAKNACVESINKPIANFIENITPLSKEEAQGLTIDMLIKDIEQALKIYQSIDNGAISEGYDSFKSFLDLNLSSKNVKDVMDKEAMCIHFLQKAQKGTLTRKEYYLENKKRLEDLILSRMKKLNLIDYKLDKETYEKIAKDYVKMYTGQISSMEEIKEMQHKILTMSEEEEIQFAKSFATRAVDKAKNTTENIDTNFQANVNLESQHPYFIDEQLDFEQAFILERGVAFSRRAMEKYLQTKGEFDLVNGAYSKLQGLKSSYYEFISKYEKDTEIIYDESGNEAFVPKEPNPDDRNTELTNYINEYFLSNPNFGVESLKEINDKQKLNLTIYQNASGKIAIDFTGYQVDEKSKNKTLNLLYRGLVQNQEKKFKDDILQGKEYEDFATANEKAYKKALGEQNCEELANAFEQDQVTFVDKATGTLSTGGLVIMCVGGVLKWIPQTTVIGLGLIAAGGKMAMTGQAAAVTLGLSEAYTRDEVSKEEVERRWKDAALLVTGMAFGTVAGAKGLKYADDILAKGGSIGTARAAQIGADFGISAIGDLAMIGLLDYDQDLKTTIKQNGIGILVSAITGNYVGNRLYKNIKGKNHEITQVRKNPEIRAKYITVDEYIKGIADKKIAGQFKEAMEIEPEFVHELIHMHVEDKSDIVNKLDSNSTPKTKSRFQANDIIVLAKLYNQKPELTRLIIDVKNTDGSYLNNNILNIFNTLTFDIDEKTLTEFINMRNSDGNPRFRAGYSLNSILTEIKNNPEIAREIIDYKNANDSYRFKSDEIASLIDNLKKYPDVTRKLLAEQNSVSDYRFSGLNIQDLISLKQDIPEIYDIIVNDVDIRGNKRDLPFDESINSEIKNAYNANPDRLIKLLKAQNQNGFLYDTNLIAKDFNSWNSLPNKTFEKIYRNKDLLLGFSYFNNIYAQKGLNPDDLINIYNKSFEGNNSASYDEIAEKCTKAILEVQLKEIVSKQSGPLKKENENMVREFLANADLEFLTKVLYAQNPLKTIMDNTPSLILSSIEQGKINIKDEKILNYVKNLVDKARLENDRASLFEAQKMVDMYNSAMGNYILVDKSTFSRALIDYANKNNPKLAKELNLYEEPSKHPKYKALRADFIKATQYESLIEYCKEANTNPEMANYLYKEIYLKNEKFPDDVLKNLVNINEKYGTKIFLSSDMSHAFKSTDFVDEELTKWQIASSGEAKMPPTLDLLTSKRDYIDDKRAYGQGVAAGFSELETSGAVSLNGNNYTNLTYALRHEIMHTNDIKRLNKFPDDTGYTDKTKYREEFVKIGIGKKNHIDYAYNNPEEFIAVAAEGDLSKCSPDFKQVLIDFGMPKWVFGLDKVDISEIHTKQPEKIAIHKRIKKTFGLTQKPTEENTDNSRIKANHWTPFKKFYKHDIDKTVDDIIAHYTKAEPEIRKVLKSFGFEDIGEFSARIKSDYSLRDKIKNFLESHPSATHKDVWNEIRDCFGMRSVVKSENYATYPEVKKLIDAGDINAAMHKAAEIQSQPAFDKVKEIILANKNGDNRISVARITNYVSKDGIPYFSEAQLAELKQFGLNNGVEIDYVRKASPYDIKAGEMDFDAKPTTRSQPSGYTALQMNFVTKKGDTIEWQFRGDQVNRFAEGEHIPYDLRTGKDITGGNKDLDAFYEPFKKILEDMDPDQYKAYNRYLDAHYTHLRNLELGFESTPPKLQDFAPKGYTFNSKLEAESLIKISNISHKLKKGEISLDVALSQYNNI